MYYKSNTPNTDCRCRHHANTLTSFSHFVHAFTCVCVCLCISFVFVFIFSAYANINTYHNIILYTQVWLHSMGHVLFTNIMYTFAYLYTCKCHVCVRMYVVKLLHLKICIIIVLWLQTFIHNICAHNLHVYACVQKHMHKVCACVCKIPFKL